ncbi:MAG: phage distal tail protein [Galactobacter sp.]
MVPFLIGGATESERWEQRRSLERLCDGRVEIRVETRDDTRSRFGYYKDGLQGDYGPGEDSPDGQKIALTFLCPDPFWYSQERSTVRQLVGLRKPFLSKPDENGLAAPFFPVILDSSTIEGEFVFDIAGDVEAWPTWHVTGPGADLLIENKFTGDRIFVSGEFREPVTIVTRPQVQDITSEGATAGELWDRVSLDSALFPLVPGKNEISISMVGASAKSSVRMSYRERFKAGY